MKFKKIGKVQYITLEENDEICITTPDKLEEEQVKITSTEEGLDISGDSSIVSSIRGDGMLEKVYLPPVVSSEEILKKCDIWLDMFRQVHDTFKKLVLTNEYRKQHVVMELSFSAFMGPNGSGKTIDLDLKHYDTIIKEGVTISIDETNDDVYLYLAANVLEYYVSQNLGNQKINLMDFDGTLYSNEKHEEETTFPMFANISLLIRPFVNEYYNIVTSIISNHNIGESSDQLIANLRNRVSNQQIGDRMDSCINHSSNQCEYILNKTLIPKK